MEIPHGHVPVVEEQTEKTHGRVEIPHGRVPVAVELTEKTRGRVEIPHGRVKIQKNQINPRLQDKHNLKSHTGV